MTPREFFDACKGHNDLTEMYLQDEWERTRWLATFIVNQYSKRRYQPKDLATFPWERESITSIEEDIKFLKERRKNAKS